MRLVRAVAIGLVLSGCAAGGGGGGQMTWVRTDGRPLDDDFRQAAEQCRTTASRAGAAAPRQEREEAKMAVMQSCMKLRGYVWRCEDPAGALGSCS